MDFSLRCNSLKCRALLTERAVVTTCSHIFCIPCSDNLGLSNPNGAQRQCPACQTTLNNLDDAVSTQLNPTEDYKTSVLSGLNPTTIMECAGRGLAFWSYQCTQEIVYQEYLAKSLTDKYGNLSLQMDKIINDANAEIETLSQRLNNMQMDQDKLKTDNANLISTLREKTRKHQQIQELYDRLKRREMTAVTQSAAFDSVDEVLQSASGRQGILPYQRGHSSFGDMNGGHGTTGRTEENHRNGSNGSVGHGQTMPPPLLRSHGVGSQPFRTANGINTMPSQHRTRLVSGLQNQVSQIPGLVRAPGPFTNSQGQTPSIRRPFSEISGNSVNKTGMGGYGMSAGIKVGRQQGSRLGTYGNSIGPYSGDGNTSGEPQQVYEDPERYR